MLIANTRPRPSRFGRAFDRGFLQARGDPAKFGAILHDLEPILVARLRKLLLAAGLRDCDLGVDDLLQAGLLRLWKYRRRYRCSRGPALAWALTVATNAGWDEIRKVIRRHTVSASDAQLAALSAGPDHPASRLLVEEVLALVNAEIDRFDSAKARRALPLRVLDHVPVADTARRVKAPTGSVGVWTMRLRRRLRPVLLAG